MDVFKNPIDQFINDLGGTSKVAFAQGLRPSVVSTWRKTGKIPNWRIAPMVALAEEAGVVIPEGIAA